MNYQNDDVKIKEIRELLPPVALLESFPATETAADTVRRTRHAIHEILEGGMTACWSLLGHAQFTTRKRRLNMRIAC